MEFKKGLAFAPKPSLSKFVDPQDVDFAIKDLLKGKRIGTYPLYSLNEDTVKRQTTYEDLRMLKSVVRPQDFMLSLDVESAFCRLQHVFNVSNRLARIGSV